MTSETSTSKRWIFFDFGGTIADTSEAFYRGIQVFFSISTADFRTVTKEQTDKFLSLNSYKDTLKLAKDMNLSTVRGNTERNLRDDIFVQAHLKYTEVFDGMIDILTTLKHTYKVGLVTNNMIMHTRPDMVNQYLESIGLEDMFDVILARNGKKVKLLQKFMRDYPDDKILAVIGDTLGDIQMAKSLDIPIHFVSWGLTKPDQLDLQPDVIYENPLDLLHGLQRIEVMISE